MYDRKKVLIVDDDEDARSFVEAILSSKDWDTFQATTGEEALDIANRETPDLVILDVSMPGMDGFEVLHRLRTDFLTKDIPVIMLTAVNTLSNEAQHTAESVGLRLGVEAPNGFVDKPVDADYLMYTIGGVLG